MPWVRAMRSPRHRAAIELLPHLIKAVNRAVLVNIMGIHLGGELEWPGEVARSRSECECLPLDIQWLLKET